MIYAEGLLILWLVLDRIYLVREVNRLKGYTDYLSRELIQTKHYRSTE